MSVGGNPGTTFKAACTSNTGHVATFSNAEYSVSLAGPVGELAQYKVGTEYVVHIRRAGDGQPDAGDPAPAAQ